MNRFYIEILPQGTQREKRNERKALRPLRKMKTTGAKSLRSLRLKSSIEFVILVSKNIPP
jgi:hypothetical protein